MSFPSSQSSFQGARLPRQGPAPILVGARTRRLLPWIPQATLNPGPAERPISGNMILQHISVRRAATILGYNESQLWKWKAEEKKILDAEGSTCSIGSGPTPSWPKMEWRLATLWQEEASNGSEITQKWFEWHALQIFKEEYLEEVTIVK
ncbi:hypothetical protein HOY80DRAFT_1032511 [Tuber brumale]|nr:hypothetical protein HOY80DRAFT_1032511 [Tuber brumale]